MTNEEIIKKSIEKAVKNGYVKEFPKETHYPLKFRKRTPTILFDKITIWNYVVILDNDVLLSQTRKPHGQGADTLFRKNIYEIIFSHDFAKAFWGEGEVCYDCGKPFTERDRVVGTMGIVHFFCCDCGEAVDPSRVEAWEYHLPVMVLEENPITYLEPFL